MGSSPKQADPMTQHELTPLVEPAKKRLVLERVPAWQFWRTTSRWHRFFLLILMSLIPFGGHFAKNSLSSLEQLMLDDPTFPISNTMYGALISAVSVPNMFLPLIGGRFLDKKGHRSIMLFLLWICVGQAIFALGMQLKWYWLALFGRVFFGVGEGSVVVGSRVFIAYWFRNRELTFAMGVAVAVTNISKMLAKATVAPIALHFGGYVESLWYSFGICVFSVLVGSLVCSYTKRLKRIVKQSVQMDEPLENDLLWLKGYADKKRIKRQMLLRQSTSVHGAEVSCESVQEFSRIFWIITILHVTFINVFHLFQNVSSSFLYQTYGYSLVKSGVVSSVSHSCVVFAPLIGLMIDQFGGRMFLIVISSILSIVAYSLMNFTKIDPVVSMLIISICLSFTPTILMAAIPNTVRKKSFGAAFGIVEITDAIGSTAGNLVIGFLRDETGSYEADMLLLLGMAVVAFLLSLVLVYEDRQSGWKLSVATTRSRTVSVDDEDPMANSVLARKLNQQISDDDSGNSSPRSGSGNDRRGVNESPPPPHNASDKHVAYADQVDVV